MSELPEGWVEAIGKDIFEIVRGVSYKKGDARLEASEGLIPILRATNIQDFKIITDDLVYVPESYVSPQQFLRRDDVLIATSSGSRNVVGKAVQFIDADVPVAFGAFCAVARPRLEHLSHYLSYYMRSRAYRRYVEEVALGININNFRTSDLSALPLYLPPEPEQRRIVAKLDRLFERTRRAREELSHIPRLIENYKKAILAAAFRGDLTKDWRSSRIPKSVTWETKSISQILIRIKAGKNLKCEERPPEDHEKGVLKVSAVTWGDFDSTQSKTLPNSFLPSEETLVKRGDFLFSRANTIELVGACVIVKEAPANLYLSDKILRLELEKEEYKPWLLWFLRSPQGRRSLEACSTGNQLSMRNISQSALRNIKIPMPGEEERAEIIARVEKAMIWLDVVAGEQSQAADLLGHLDQANLAKAFRGELVPQDPSDEPASALLERIRAERAGQPKAGRKKRSV